MRFLLIGPTVLRTSSKLSTYLTFRICQRSTEYSSCPATFRWTCRSPRETSFLARVSSTTYSSGTLSKGIRPSQRPPNRPLDLRWSTCFTPTPALLNRSLKTTYGRGFDDLPPDILKPVAGALVGSLQKTELIRALGKSVDVLLQNSKDVSELAQRLGPQLRELKSHQQK